MSRDAPTTRDRILQAAGELFYSDGIRSVSVDAVAERAGVTKRTLYYHFKGKDALVAAYLAARDGPTLAWLTGAAARAEGDLAARIAAMFKALARWGRSAEAKGCPFARAAAELAGQPDHPAHDAARRHKTSMEDWLQGEIAAAGLTQAEMRARQIMTLVDGAITQMLIHRDPAYAEAAGAAAAALLGGAEPSRS